jgi:hypothetical protein
LIERLKVDRNIQLVTAGKIVRRNVNKAKNQNFELAFASFEDQQWSDRRLFAVCRRIHFTKPKFQKNIVFNAIEDFVFSELSFLADPSIHLFDQISALKSNHFASTMPSFMHRPLFDSTQDTAGLRTNGK